MKAAIASQCFGLRWVKLREVEQQLIRAQGDIMGWRARLRVRAGRQEHRSFLDMRMNELLHNSHGEVTLVLDYEVAPVGGDVSQVWI